MDKKNEFIVFQELKHKNNKEIIDIKEHIDNKRHIRKIEFVKFLYNLKKEFLKEQEQYKINRTKIILSKKK